jgi:flagellar hook assembly protein FlgD
MILQNYPNPFNPQTTIRFYSESLEQNQPVTIEIFNVKGQQIKQINIKNEIGKMNEILWNGSDNTGKPVPSGIYFYKLNIINSPVNKMIFLK